MKKSKIVFLDRDGTLNEEVNYCSSPDELFIIPDALKAVKYLKKNDFLAIVISNQSGVARGYFTKETLDSINQKLEAEFDRYGASLDGIYCCICHPDDNCICRKPNFGLLTLASKKYVIDYSKSYMIGDRISDVEAGRNFGIEGLLLSSRKYKDILNFETIIDAVEYIIDNDI